MKLDFLFQLQSPRFGIFATRMLIAFALLLAVSPVEYVPGERSLEPATVISFLPAQVLVSPSFYVLIRWVLIVSAIGWMFGKYTPWTCWATCISFTLLHALQIENTIWTDHVFNMTNMLLYVHAMWFQFYDQPMRDSIEAGTFQNASLYPRWVFLLSVFYIGLFHSLSGFSKIHHSGFDWPNGLSLQLWVEVFGWEHSPVARFILSHRTAAWVIQTFVLVVQTIALLALVSRYFRWLIGVGLITFYVGFIATTLDFSLLFNTLIVGVFFLPFEPVLNRSRAPEGIKV